MTFEIVLLLVLLAVAVGLFATEVVSVDVAALALLLGLYFTGLVGSEEIFRGFGNEIILFLGSLFVITEGLVRTGVLDRLEALLAGQAERRPGRLVLLMMLGVGATSAFLSNTATMAAFLPVAIGLARRLRRPPSKLLMPLAFASILGGTCTLLGTSTNIVVSGFLPRLGLPPFSLFELAPVGLPVLAVGLGYLMTIGRRLLPERGGEPLEDYRLRPYITEAILPNGSPWAGKTLDETGAGQEVDVQILGRVGEHHRVVPIPRDEPLQVGDILLVQGTQESLLKLKERRELDLVADRAAARKKREELAHRDDKDKKDREKKDKEKKGRQPLTVHELLLAPHSRIAGKSLQEQSFRNRYQVTVLAVYRRGAPRRTRLGRLRLREGDVLLVQGELTRLRWLLASGDLILLDQTEVRAAGGRTYLAVALFAAMIVTGGFGWAPFAVAAFTAASLMLLTRCVTSAEAYAAVDWRILVMIGCLLAFATAMENTGTADYLADGIVELVGNGSPLLLLAGFYILTVALTQPMSNQAAALVVLPIALQTATEMGLDPRTFAVTVALAASSSFITPLEPASLLVYGPGRYRFRDFFKVGLPLTLLVLAITLLLVPRIWPLEP